MHRFVPALPVILLFLAGLLFPSASHAQDPNDSTGMKQFNRALDHYTNHNLDSAISIWTEMVEKKTGLRYDTYGNAFFNIPTVYWQMEKYDKAKEWYKKIIESDLRDNDETGSLMEPHTNYKHKSALALSGLYSLDSNYTEALHWIELADTVYRYWGFEGSATNISLEQAYMLNGKVDILLQMGRKEEAIRAIVTELICAGGLKEFFRESEERLMGMIDKAAFRIALEKAVDGIRLITVDEKNWVAVFQLQGLTYRIPMTKVYPQRNIPHYWHTLYAKENDTVDVPYMVAAIKNSRFYQDIVQ